MSILKPNEINFGKTQIPVHDTWDVLDATKIKCLMGCPRDFFYSYILGWRVSTPGIHLAFGGAWHKAMEVMLTQEGSAETIGKAYQAFIDFYQEKMQREVGELELLHNAKKPSAVLDGLVEYQARWQDNPTETDYIEVAGTAPIDNSGRVIHVKLDSIRTYPAGHFYEGKKYSLEHKTASQLSAKWEEQWNYDFQVGGYDHFGKCWFEPDEFVGVVINGAIFRASSNKKPREFIRVPAHRSIEMWDLWRGEANHWWDYLERNMEALHETKESDTAMFAFPRNSASCSKFGCRHPQLCSIQANPLQHCHQPPLDYKVDFWDPRRQEAEAQKVVHLANTSEEVNTSEGEEKE